MEKSSYRQILDFVSRSLLCGLLSVCIVHPGVTHADSMNEEINYLIRTVGTGGCTFIRNGHRFNRRDARAHLKSKRRRNAHIVDSTEAFIEKIASQSTATGKPYVVRCRGKNQHAGIWLTELLAEYRKPES